MLEIDQPDINNSDGDVPAIEEAASLEIGSRSVPTELVQPTTPEDTATGFNVSSARVGQRLSGIDVRTIELVTGKIMSRAGKVSGKHKPCFNIKKDADNTVTWYNLQKNFSDSQEISDKVEMLIMYNSDIVMTAKETELKNWEVNDVYGEVEDVGQRSISMRWVVTEKLKGGETVTRTRLVSRGFEEDSSGFRKDSPKCSNETIRIVLSIASTKTWECHSLDVKAAYLQGNSIERDVFLRSP